MWMDLAIPLVLGPCKFCHQTSLVVSILKCLLHGYKTGYKILYSLEEVELGRLWKEEEETTKMENLKKPQLHLQMFGNH